MTKNSVNPVSGSGSNYRGLIESLGINPNSVTVKILGVTVSSFKETTLLSFFSRIKGTDVQFSITRKSNNAELVAELKDFEANFKEGDYNITGCEIRVKGESYTLEDGTTGVYKIDAISIPYVSNIRYLGADYVAKFKQEALDDMAREFQAMSFKAKE